MLEVPARLAALQRQHALLGSIPERFGPLIGDRNWPGHLAPVAHRHALSLSHGVPVSHGKAFLTHFCRRVNGALREGRYGECGEASSRAQHLAAAKLTDP